MGVTVMAKVESSDRFLQLRIQEREAWQEYLDTTRELEGPFGYEEVEPWAYARLGRRLAQIQDRRREIEDEDGA